MLSHSLNEVGETPLCTRGSEVRLPLPCREWALVLLLSAGSLWATLFQVSQQDLLSFARLKSDVVSVGCVRDRSATQATGELFRMLCFQEVSGNSGHKRDTHTQANQSRENNPYNACNNNDSFSPKPTEADLKSVTCKLISLFIYVFRPKATIHLK